MTENDNVLKGRLLTLKAASDNIEMEFYFDKRAKVTFQKGNRGFHIH